VLGHQLPLEIPGSVLRIQKPGGDVRALSGDLWEPKKGLVERKRRNRSPYEQGMKHRRPVRRGPEEEERKEGASAK